MLLQPQDTYSRAPPLGVLFPFFPPFFPVPSAVHEGTQVCVSHSFFTGARFGGELPRRSRSSGAPVVVV